MNLKSIQSCDYVDYLFPNIPPNNPLTLSPTFPVKFPIFSPIFPIFYFIFSLILFKVFPGLSIIYLI